MHVPYAVTATFGWTGLAALLYAGVASLFTYPENWLGGLLLVPLLVVGLVTLPFLLIPAFRRLLVRLFTRPAGGARAGADPGVRPGWLSRWRCQRAVCRLSKPVCSCGPAAPSAV
jgi:hypothetical protein